MNCIATTCLSAHLLREALGVSFLEHVGCPGQAKLIKEKHVAYKLQPKLKLFKPGNASDINVQISSLLKSWNLLTQVGRTSGIGLHVPLWVKHYPNPRISTAMSVAPPFPADQRGICRFFLLPPPFLPGKFQRLRKLTRLSQPYGRCSVPLMSSLGGSDDGPAPLSQK